MKPSEEYPELYKRFSDLYDSLPKKKKSKLMGDMFMAATIKDVEKVIETYEN